MALTRWQGWPGQLHGSRSLRRWVGDRSPRACSCSAISRSASEPWPVPGADSRAAPRCARCGNGGTRWGASVIPSQTGQCCICVPGNLPQMLLAKPRPLSAGHQCGECLGKPDRRSKRVSNREPQPRTQTLVFPRFTGAYQTAQVNRSGEKAPERVGFGRPFRPRSQQVGGQNRGKPAPLGATASSGERLSQLSWRMGWDSK